MLTERSTRIDFCRASICRQSIPMSCMAVYDAVLVSYINESLLHDSPKATVDRPALPNRYRFFVNYRGD